MPNIMNQELVRAFNIILCHNEVAITNLIVQSTDQTFLKKEDRIVISFDKNMDVGQCMKYLHNIKKSIVETFCGSESGANMSFNTQFFPFNLNERQLTKDKEGYKFSVPIDKGVVFNLKCLLAHGLAKDAKEDMGNEFGERCMEGRVYDVRFDRKSYLYCMRFYDKKLQDYFVESFSSRIKNYKNGPKSTNDFLKIKDNCVYIKGSIFNKAKFIKDIVKHKASLECRDFEVTSAEDETVESLKFPVIDLSRTVGIPINSVLHVSYTGSGENSVLIPAAKEIIDNIIYYQILSKEQADDINKVFGMTVLNNVEDCISPKHLPVFGRRGIYGIDFANQDISYCVLNKIMESSVINKDHELAIDPELPRTLLAEASQTRGCPKRSRGKGLERPPRQGSEREGGKGGLFQLVPGKIDSSQSTGDQSQLSSGEIDLSQSTGDQSQLSLGAGEGTLTEANIQDQKRSSSIPSLRAWDSSTFLNSEDSLKDTENICNEEPEKQQVTDESDRKSSDECSEAKPQSESPSSRKGSESNSFSGSSTLSKKSIMPELEKLFILELEKWFLYFQQNGKKLDSTRSTHELSSKKTATSSERKVKSNSPSKVTPVTEVHTENKPTELNDSITELPSQGTVGKLNMPGDRSSKISVDSGLGSLERGQSPSLIEEFSDSLQQTPLIVDKLENIFSKLLSVVHNLLKNPASPTHKDVSGGLKLQQHLDSDQREKLYKALSSKMKKKLDSELFLPEYEKLLYLLYVDKREVRLLLSPPGEVEQVCSVLPSEEKEQAQSSSSEEVVRLFQEFFSNQKVSDNYLTSSKIDSPEIETCLKKEISQAVCT